MAASPSADVDALGGPRRASGRARKQPENYAASPFGGSKRKRSEQADGEDGEDVEMADEQASDEDEEDEEESTEGEPDEEELRERKKARKPQKASQKKPAPKKARVDSTALPIRSAGAGRAKKRAPKKQLKMTDAAEAGGLYAEVFAGDGSHEHVASEWLKGFEEKESQALADLINFILKCAGCDSKVECHDIEDADAVTTKLTDVQDEHQASSPTADYPLVAKGKAAAALKETFAAFLNTVVKTIAAKGTLVAQPELIENLDNWLHTMSSCSDRALRHTATFASLTITTALCEVSAASAKESAATQRQGETEGKRAKPNKARVKHLEEKVREEGRTQSFIEFTVKESFDAVFIHRYRDVDPQIRRDCVTALGDWITTLPNIFLDGQHLRYLGWVLSDTAAVTRGEVVKQLQRLYKGKDRIGGLKTFTERFRSRMVEIATDDAEYNVRAMGIELVDLLRDNGLLEPSDVDNVGRLVYDSDARARKAVAGFFAENVNDLFNSKVDDLGGLDNLEEVLPEVGEANFEAPRIEWLKFKSLAEMMAAYDTEEALPTQVQHRSNEGSLTLHAAAMESRFTLAADVLYPKIDDAKDWRALSGYLLFDHSTGRANGVADDTLSQLKHESILTEKEEVILLEVVSASVKRSIIEMAESATSTKSKLNKRQKEQLSEDQEEAARHLASLIPKLLKKFGDVPSTAAAVLRMESALDLPSMHDLRQDSVTYGALLDDIRKQFMSHGSDEVLGPASQAILHAQSYGELDDLTEEKLAGLWEDVVNNLNELVDPYGLATRGNMQPAELVALSNNLLRITRLAHVSNCTTALEDDTVIKNNEAAKKVGFAGPIDYVIDLVQRAHPSDEPAVTAEVAALEDEVAHRAGEAALRYLLWKLNYIVDTMTNSTVEFPSAELEAIAGRRDAYVDCVQAALQARKASDPICAALAGYMLDLHTSAVVLKTITLKPGMRNDWDVLILDLHTSYSKAILKVFTAAEKSFATLTGKKLEDPSATTTVGDHGDLDADPIDDDPLSDSDDDADEPEPQQQQTQHSQSQTNAQARLENKRRAALVAERTLCELTRSLIFAVHAGVVNVKETRARLERNRTRLGPNYKEMLNYLDLDKAGPAGARKKGGKAGLKGKGGAVKGREAKGKKSAKSNAIVAEDEVEDEIEDGDVDGEDEEALRRRGLVVEDGEDEEVGAGAEGAGAGDKEAESVVGD